MSKLPDVVEFIKWALKNANYESQYKDAKFPISVDSAFKTPWHYLFGSVRVQTTAQTVEKYWNNHYKNAGWTRAQYDAATKGWKSTDYATDCQGLLDAYITYQLGTKTDINADMNYKQWCTSVIKVAGSTRPYEIGEALFVVNSSNKASHVGWICGFDAAGNPLAVEARGLSYGVVVTKVSERQWTHRGLMTKKFTYGSVDNNSNKPNESGDPKVATVFSVKSPMLSGSNIKLMQQALNANGYTDDSGNKLSEDGKWGSKSQQALTKFVKAHTTLTPAEPVVKPIAVFESTDKKYCLNLVTK